MRELERRTALVTGGGRGIDVANSRDVREVALGAREAMGRVDILVNNAGTASSNPVRRVTLEEWHHVMAVNVASSAGLKGAKYISAYTASKHAVVGFTRAVAAEVEGTGVTVNALCPGYVHTPLTQEAVARIIDKTGKSYAEAMRALLQQGGTVRTQL